MNIIETIRREVERINEDIVSNNIDCHPTTVLDDILSFLDTLEEKPTPEGLDEAAFKYSSGSPFFNTEYSAFKAGAEWAFGQGMIREGKIVSESGEVGWIEYDTPAQVELMEHFKKGDEIVLQIRKKN